MTREEVINILQNINLQCQNDCPISRDDCAKQENKCLVSEALEYAVDFLSADVRGSNHGEWINPEMGYEDCSVCGYCFAVYDEHDRYIERNFCPNCGANMRERK